MKCSLAHSVSPTHKKSVTSVSTRLDLCDCLPVVTAAQAAGLHSGAAGSDDLVVISHRLRHELLTLLHPFLRTGAALSVLLLHLGQLASAPLDPDSASLFEQKCYHIPAESDLLQQILEYVQQVLRCDDQLLMSAQAGALLVFPHVDSQGAHAILERVYARLNTLHAEIFDPPLTRETIITMSIGSHESSGAGSEAFYHEIGHVAHRVIVRPAITTQLRGVRPLPSLVITPFQGIGPVVNYGEDDAAIPFMRLPTILAQQLQQYIPCSLARQLLCVPVGCDRHTLTVAMSDPTNQVAIQQLQQHVGMAIFPVSCDSSSLRLLLAQGW